MPERGPWEDKVTFALLEHPKDWQLRAVEKIELSSHRWSVRTRKLHVKELRKVSQPAELAEWLSDAPEECVVGGEVTVVLPLSQMTKNAVVDFEARVNGREVSRLSREEGARLQMRYFLHLLKTKMEFEGEVASDRIQDMLVAIFGSTSVPKGLRMKKFIQDRVRISQPEGKEKWWKRKHELVATLQAAKDVREYITEKVIAGRVLPKAQSAAQNPILALPYLDALLAADGHGPLSDEELASRLLELKGFLEGMVNHESPERDYLLKLYAEYGRHWEAFARCFVPVDRQFILTVTTKRHIQFDNPEEKGILKPLYLLWYWLRPVAWSHARFADAESNHVNIRVPDMNVELKDRWCNAYNEIMQNLRVHPNHTHKTRELFAIYSSSKDRDDRIWIKTPLRMARPTGWIHVLVIGTILATLTVTWIVWGSFERRLTAQQLALLLTPSTFAASLLIVRESSPLSAKFTAPARGTIAACLCALWVGALFLFIKGHIHVDENKPTPKPSPTVVPATSSVEGYIGVGRAEPPTDGELVSDRRRPDGASSVYSPSVWVSFQPAESESSGGD